MGNSNRSCPFLKQTEIQIGIDRGNEMFENQYVIIGGTACDLIMENEELPFRAQKM